MKKYQKIITGFALGGGILWANANIFQKRSLSSWTIETALKATGIKRIFEKKTPQQFSRLLEKASRISNDSVSNPSKLIGTKVQENQIDGMQVFVWNDRQDKNQSVILYTHGGAYLYQPTYFHFKAVNNLSKKLDAKVIFPIYPKAPKHTYQESFEKLDKLYQNLLKTVNTSKQITFMGDSAGGGLALGFAMYIRDHHLPQPKDIILLSPWLDVSTQNPEIKNYEKVDPMLSSWGLNKMGELWAGSKEAMINPYVSPIFGHYNDLGRISIFVGSHEIFLPDNQKLHERLEQETIAHYFTISKKMNHVYVIYPIPEARDAQDAIVRIVNEKQS